MNIETEKFKKIEIADHKFNDTMNHREFMIKYVNYINPGQLIIMNFVSSYWHVSVKLSLNFPYQSTTYQLDVCPYSATCEKCLLKSYCRHKKTL